MFALEGVGFATCNLQVQEGCQVGNLLLDARQTNQTVEFLQTVVDTYRLWCLVWDILAYDGHELLVAHHRDVCSLQALCLFLANLVEERTHGTTVGKVFVARVVHFLDHLLRQCLGIRREDILLLLGKYLHNLEQLGWRVVLDIKEIVETAAESRVHTEQILHLRAITGGNHDKLSTIVLHTFHQLFQSLCALGITIARRTHRCQGVGLVNKQNTALGLIAKGINHLRCFALILTYHLGTINLDYVATIQIADGCKDFAQLTGDSGFTCTWVTCKNNVHRHFLLLAQSTLGALHSVLYRVGHLFYSGLYLVHTNVAVKILQDILNRTFLRYIARDIAQLYP